MNNNLKSQIEAILFISPEAISERKIASIVSKPLKEIQEKLKELESQYNGDERGIHLLEQGGKWQFVTAKHAADILKKVMEEEEEGELTRPSLEALSIIAYRGPVSRVEIEYIRGVQSSLILRNLMIRGLVEEMGPEDNPKYQVTPEFMRAVGVTKIEELPKFDELYGKELEELL